MTSEITKNTPKSFALNRDLLRYGKFWMIPGETSYPDGSEYVWQRGVESLQGQVTAARSWPLFREKKYLRRCCKKPPGRNFDFRAKSAWEDFFNSRSTGISQLRAGKTRSKRPRSHWLSTVHLLPYMWASFYPLDPSRYLSSFSSWRPKRKKFPFFTNSISL